MRKRNGWLKGLVGGIRLGLQIFGARTRKTMIESRKNEGENARTRKKGKEEP